MRLVLWSIIVTLFVAQTPLAGATPVASPVVTERTTTSGSADASDLLSVRTGGCCRPFSSLRRRLGHLYRGHDVLVCIVVDAQIFRHGDRCLS
jgi:hypothetical protein